MSSGERVWITIIIIILIVVVAWVVYRNYAPSYTTPANTDNSSATVPNPGSGGANINTNVTIPGTPATNTNGSY